MEHKEIILSYEKRFDTAEIKTIGIFNDYFKDDIRIEYNNNIVTVLLKEVDVDKLREVTSQLSLIVQSSLYKDVIREVESIKSYGIKGKKRQYVSYNDERKVVNRKEKESNRNQHYYANSNTFASANQDLPPKFVNCIISGDSENELKLLPDNSIDLILTSPPYNFGLDYESGDDSHHWETYFSKLFSVFDQCIRVLKYGGRFIVNVQPLFSDYIPSHHIISNYLMHNKMIWKGEILWEKNNYNCKYTAWGSWKSPSNPYLKYTWEFIEVFCKGSLKLKGESANADITGDEFKKWVVSKWSIAPERNMKQYNHPAMFPEELVDRVLKLFCFKGDIVLDPFNGVGTTTLVAKRLGRRYLGIDISEEYCRIAQQRITDQVSQEGMFANV